MTDVKLDKFCLVAAIAALLALIFPLSGVDPESGKQIAFVSDIPGIAVAMALCVIAGAAFTWLGVGHIQYAAIILAVAVFGCWQAIEALYDYGIAGHAGTGFWLFILSLWAFVWRGIDVVARYRSLETAKQQSANILVPIAFGVWLLFLWEVIVAGLACRRFCCLRQVPLAFALSIRPTFWLPISIRPSSRP